MRSTMAAQWAVVVGLAGTFALPAGAQRTSSLSWVRLEGAERCISTHALAQRVEARVGRRVFVSASQADLSLEGHVKRDGDALVAELVVSDPTGTMLGRRVLRVTGTDCSALEASLVLVIAIGIDPDAALPAEASLSDETKTMLAQLELPKLSEDAVLELAVPVPAPTPHAARRLRTGRSPPIAAARAPSPPPPPPGFELGFQLGATLELGVLPQPAFGLSLRIRLTAPMLWPVELAVTGALPQSEPLAPAGSSGEFRFWAAGVAVCPLQLAGSAFGFEACAGLRVGSISADGVGFRQPLTAAGTWLDAALEGGPQLQLDRDGRLRLALRGRIAAPIMRDTFVYEDRRGGRQQAHRASVVIAGLELGAQIFF